jgi:hypothetical protein
MSTANKESKAFSDAVQPGEEMNLDSMKEAESMEMRGESGQNIEKYLVGIMKADGWLLENFDEGATPTIRTPIMRAAYHVILILYDAILKDRHFSKSDVFYTIDHFAPPEEEKTDIEGYETRDNAFGAHKLALTILNQLDNNQELETLRKELENTEIRGAVEMLAGEEYRWFFLPHQTEIRPHLRVNQEMMLNISRWSILSYSL